MKIETYGNETRINFRKNKDPEHATVSVTFPEKPGWYLFVDKDGRVSWFNENSSVLKEIGQVPL